MEKKPKEPQQAQDIFYLVTSAYSTKDYETFRAGVAALGKLIIAAAAAAEKQWEYVNVQLALFSRLTDIGHAIRDDSMAQLVYVRALEDSARVAADRPRAVRDFTTTLCLVGAEAYHLQFSSLQGLVKTSLWKLAREGILNPESLDAAFRRAYTFVHVIKRDELARELDNLNSALVDLWTWLEGVRQRAEEVPETTGDPPGVSPK